MGVVPCISRIPTCLRKVLVYTLLASLEVCLWIFEVRACLHTVEFYQS